MLCPPSSAESSGMVDRPPSPGSAADEPLSMEEPGGDGEVFGPRAPHRPLFTFPA